MRNRGKRFGSAFFYSGGQIGCESANKSMIDDINVVHVGSREPAVVAEIDR